MTYCLKRLLVSPAIALTLLAGLLTPVETISAASVTGRIIHDPKVMNGIANDILNGLDQARMEEFFLLSGSERLSVNIVPFRPLNIENEEVSLAFSSELNAFLLSSLSQKSRGKFRFHINKLEVGDDKSSYQQQKLCSPSSVASKCAKRIDFTNQNDAASTADISIRGRLVIYNDAGYISYKAFAPETGVILAATTPRKLNIRFSRTSSLVGRQLNAPSDSAGEYLEPSRWRIYQLQRDLELLGFRPGRINGYLTRQTRQAIKRYQWHHDMDPDGNVSQALLKHIRKEVVMVPLRYMEENPSGRSGA